MGKSLNGKELGSGISQRKDGIYQGRFTNRFGKRQTIYSKSLNEIRKELRTLQYEDEKAINVVTKNMTLDEWCKVWMDTCKKNCRSSTKATYLNHYKRIQNELGWRQLTSLNLVIIQQAINGLNTDNQRKNSKKILVDMLNKAVDSDLLIKNPAKAVNTTITKEEKKERRVLTKQETNIFLDEASRVFYYNLFVLALETGMRVGELTGLKWEDIDYNRKVIYVRHTLCYFSKDGKYTFEMHDTKTQNGKRTIPLTRRAIDALQRQRIQTNIITLASESKLQGEYKGLVFVTKNNKPVQMFLVQECLTGVIKRIRENYPSFGKITPHCLRHTFATRAIENGMSPKSLQKILGHGTLQMTMDLYCHVTDDSLYQAMSLMES